MDLTPALPTSLAPAELLPDPLDPVITRPLALHNGHAYAAAWPYLHHAPGAADELDPRTRATTLVLARDDGLLSIPAAPTGALVRLATLPPLPAGRLWTTAGLQAYTAGRRPDPAQVFAALTAAFDTFMDFTGSLAAQTAVAEFLAVYTLATWFLPAFTTFSHLWILGDHGAGKTRLLHLLAGLTHLGAVLPSAVPLAPLRDLAALGASLAVDQADGLFASLSRGPTVNPGAASLRQGLFLAGARRDVLYPLRQRLSRRGDPPAYGLTHLDVFGPRLFAAHQAPHPVLAARAIFLPLLRSTDHARCAADPENPAAWPLPPRDLTDQLWALSLAHLTELPAHVDAVTRRAKRVDAYFQNWQPYLAIADWLTAHGVRGLTDRLRAFMSAYPAQAETLAPQGADLTALAIRAIYAFVGTHIDKMVALYRQVKTSDKSDKARVSSDKSDKARVSSDKSDKPRVPSDNSDQPRASNDGAASISAGSHQLEPALVTLLYATHFYFSAAMLHSVMQTDARNRTWDDIADRLTPNQVGKILVRLRITQQRTNTARLYEINLERLDHLLDAYRLPQPSILVTYPSFSEASLRAKTPRPANDPPLEPPSPTLLALLGPVLGILPQGAAGPQPNQRQPNQRQPDQRKSDQRKSKPRPQRKRQP